MTPDVSEEAAAEYYAAMARVRHTSAQLAERLAERAAVWGPAWEAVLRMSGTAFTGGTTYRPSTTANEEDYSVTSTLTPGARYVEYVNAGPKARRILDELAREEDRSVALEIGPSGRPVQYDALTAALIEQVDALTVLADKADRFKADNQEPPKKLVDDLLDAATRLSLTVEQAEKTAAIFAEAAPQQPTLYRHAAHLLSAQINLAKLALEG